MELGAEHSPELGLLGLPQHTQGPQHVHLKGRPQACQLTLQFLMHLEDRMEGTGEGSAQQMQTTTGRWVLLHDLTTLRPRWLCSSLD